MKSDTQHHKTGLLARLLAFFRRPQAKPRPQPNAGLSQFTDEEWAQFLNDYLKRKGKSANPPRPAPRPPARGRQKYYVGRSEAILAALKAGPMTRQQLQAVMPLPTKLGALSSALCSLHKQRRIHQVAGDRWAITEKQPNNRPVSPSLDKPAGQA